MAEVQGGGPGSAKPLGPQEKKLYEQEYKHAADLFQRALEEHGKSDNIYQKEEFRQVMDKALLVLNETAREMKRKGLLKQNQKIQQDYDHYQKDPSPDMRKALNRDLEQAKKSA